MVSISMPLVYAFITSLVLTVIFGKLAIPMLKRLHAQQSIREEGPESHKKKSGTPTMGGLFLLFCSSSPWGTPYLALVMILLRLLKREI